MAVVDKYCIDSAFLLIEEQRLPVVCMSSADIDEPRKPESLTIPNSSQTAAGKNFVKSGTFAKKSGTKAKTRARAKNTSFFWPTPLIPFQK
jgi:hypothetical protein